VNSAISRDNSTVIDGGALLWIIQWPNKGIVQVYVDSVLEYIFRKLEDSDVNVIFDRYFEYSTKSTTRTSQTVQQASRRHKLTPSAPLPAQTTASCKIPESKYKRIEIK